jgi:hypothetical protein
VHYGLGSLNENLPQFVSMGTREYWNQRDGHYLGPAHDAVPLRIDPDRPLDFARAEHTLVGAGQRGSIDLIRRLNELRGIEYPDDPAIDRTLPPIHGPRSSPSHRFTKPFAADSSPLECDG